MPEPTVEQIRANFLQRMATRLKTKRNRRSGWQAVHVTPNGTVLYGYVQRGRVTEAAIGSKELLRHLRTIVPGADHGPLHETVAEQPTDGSGESCTSKFWKCNQKTLGTLWSGIKLFVNAITLDIEDIEEQIEAEHQRLIECVGPECARALGLT